MLDLLKAAKAAKTAVACLDTQHKNKALLSMAAALEEHTQTILEANRADMEKARGVISDVMLDRLHLSEGRIRAMADGIRAVAELPDPVGRVLESFTRADGLEISKIAVPMGVVAIIYESRPNVTSDAAALALKSGNVCVLRGGKEAFGSAKAIVDALREGLIRAQVMPDAVCLVTDTSRESARSLMTAREYVDLLIPRGGAGLINACVENATVPCIATGTGICHVYVEATADLVMAQKIVENAKTSRPSVCNAEEVLLVDRAVAAQFLPMIYDALVTKRKAQNLPPVELRLDASAADFIKGTPAKDGDFDTEFLDYILAVKVVENVQEAVAHITAHSTGHSDAIVTQSDSAREFFIKTVDSAAVYVNASTRFTDGGEFGLGCEMGISTQKLHARGPMGLCELTTYKYVICGSGHIR